MADNTCAASAFALAALSFCTFSAPGLAIYEQNEGALQQLLECQVE
jgi:hypothetical protein